MASRERLQYGWFPATTIIFSPVKLHRKEALEAIEGVQWLPASGKKRIIGMTQGRSDWCISRQRKWGVPIPVFYDKDTGAVAILRND